MTEPDAATLDAVAADLDAVEVALARLEAGTYGTCERCGGELPDVVLADRPVARACAACSESG